MHGERITITRGEIEARIIILQNERQRRLDDVNAFNGAIQQCEWLLAQLDQPAEGLTARLAIIAGDGQLADE